MVCGVHEVCVCSVYVHVCMCVCACVYVCMYMCVCMCVCMQLCKLLLCALVFNVYNELTVFLVSSS